MSNQEDIFGRVLEQWVDNTIESISQWAAEEKGDKTIEDFAQEYIQVLNSAKKQIDKVQCKFAQFSQELQQERINRGNLISKYVDAMTVDYNGEQIFLPCFSDNILRSLSQSTGEYLSPYRGLYYGWKLGEIHHKWTKKEDKPPKEEMEELLNEVSDAIKFTKSPRYLLYVNRLGKDSSFDEHVRKVKKSLKKVVFERKWLWEKIFPYPPITSTHFYLSGIRYYLYPALYRPEKLDDNMLQERFYVNSTDSGLFKPCEHYGSILGNPNDLDEIEELLETLPPGSLMLDLVKEENGSPAWNTEVTKLDRQNLVYFEIWSQKVSQFTQQVLTGTLNRLNKGGERKAYEYFRDKIRKNPLRKFYFDTGIYQAVRLSQRFRNLYPPISYLTTSQSKVPSQKFRLAWKILDHYMGKGIEYFYIKTKGWKGQYRPLGTLTLFPSENLARLTSFLSSERDAAIRKIIHGLSFHAEYAYIYVNNPSVFRIARSPTVKIVLIGLELVSNFGFPIVSLGTLILELIRKGISLLEKQLPTGALNRDTLSLLQEARNNAIRIQNKKIAENHLRR